MANSTVQDIIRFAAKLQECEAIVTREASLKQAVAEAEARLAQIRADEEKTAKDFNERYAQAQAAVAAENARAEAATRRASDQVSAILLEAEADATARKEKANAAVLAAAAREAAHTEKVVALEAEETRLAQSVSALRAELDALKARVLG